MATVRTTRDGWVWVGEQRAPLSRFNGDLGGISHFTADTVAGDAKAFLVRENGEADQTPPQGVIAIARRIEADFPAVLAGMAEEARMAAAEREAVAQARPAADRRAERYRGEADPFLLAAMGYRLEYDANPSEVARDKLAKATADYLAAKAKIRQEIPS